MPGTESKDDDRQRLRIPAGGSDAPAGIRLSACQNPRQMWPFSPTAPRQSATHS